MSFRALLVTKDDQAEQIVAPVLADLGLAVECCGYSDAVCLVSEQKFQAVLVDYDDPHSAAVIFQNISNSAFYNHPVTVALLRDRNKVHQVFGVGANFVLYKPVRHNQAVGTLRAATALMKRERRNAFRVPIQVEVKLRLENPDGMPEMEGILLDISDSGMDVLAPQPLYPSARLSARFTLPNSPSEFEVSGDVAWANPNGESGIRLVDTPDSLRAALQNWLIENYKETAPEEPQPVGDCQLTDLSLGGCYVETASPFPKRTHVLLILRAEGVELQTHGLVRVMHPSRGMGVEFATRKDRQRQQTESFIHFLVAHPGVQPQLLVSPQGMGADTESLCVPSDDLEDPLLDLIRNHQAFSEEMFLQTLKSQRSAEFVECEE